MLRCMCRSVTMNSIRSLMGMTQEDNIGKIAFPAVQAAPCFPTSFPHIFGTQKNIRCLIPCAIDQVRGVPASAWTMQAVLEDQHALESASP